MAKAGDHVLAAYQSEQQRPCGRDGEKELCRFLSIAASSASELEYQLLLAHDLDYLSRDAYMALNEQIPEVKRMLYRFMQSLNSTS